MKKPKHVRKKLIFFGTILLLFVFLFIAFYIYEVILLSNQKAKVAKKDLFMTSLQINEKYGPDKNSRLQTEHYCRVLSLYIPPPSDQPDIYKSAGLKKRLYYNEKISPPQLHSILEVLAVNQSFLKAYDQLEDIQSVCLFEDFAKPDYLKIRTDCINALCVANLYYLKNEIEFMDNRIDEVMDNIRKIADSDAFAVNLPFKIANELLVHNIQLTTYAINRAVNSISFNHSQLRKLIDILAEKKEKLHNNQKIVLMGIASDFFIQLDSGKRYATGSDLFWSSLKKDKTLLRMKRKITSWPGFDDFNDKLVMLKEIIELDGLLRNYAVYVADEAFWQKFNHNREGSLLAENLDVEKFYQTNIQALSMINIQTVLIASLIYEKQHLRFPENIKMLVEVDLLTKRMAIDPFNGKPLQIIYDRSLNSKGILRLVVRVQDRDRKNTVKEDMTSTSYIISGTWGDDILLANNSPVL